MRALRRLYTLHQAAGSSVLYHREKKDHPEKSLELFKVPPVDKSLHSNVAGMYERLI
jgi:hypothetical protein